MLIYGAAAPHPSSMGVCIVYCKRRKQARRLYIYMYTSRTTRAITRPVRRATSCGTTSVATVGSTGMSSETTATAALPSARSRLAAPWPCAPAQIQEQAAG